MVGSEVKCFSGVKTAHNSKTEDGIERKKAWRCEAEGRRCSWGKFTSRKTRRMHRKTASAITWDQELFFYFYFYFLFFFASLLAASEMASLPWSPNNRKENAARTKKSMRGPGSSWSYLCRGTKNTTTCMSCHNRGVHVHSCIMGNQGKIAGNSKICIESQLILPEFKYLILSLWKE